MLPFKSGAAFCRFVFLFCLLSLGGCSASYLFSDFDPSIDRSRYHSYSWSEPEGRTVVDPAASPFVYGRIRAAAEREFAVRGYELKKIGPVDFIVNAHVVRLLASSFYQGSLYYRHFYSRNFHRNHLFFTDPWWGAFGPLPALIYHEEGYLVIDIIDAPTGKPAWRGSLPFPFYPESEGRQDDIDRTVREIVESFSPVKKGK